MKRYTQTIGALTFVSTLSLGGLAAAHIPAGSGSQTQTPTNSSGVPPCTPANGSSASNGSSGSSPSSGKTNGGKRNAGTTTPQGASARHDPSPHARNKPGSPGRNPGRVAPPCEPASGSPSQSSPPQVSSTSTPQHQ